MKISTKKIVTSAFLIAISFVLANIKIMGSIAFDSLPAFLAGLMFGGITGGMIGAIAHMFSSLLAGFPYGLPVHLIISAIMCLTIYLFTITYSIISKGGNRIIAAICAGIIGTALNGPFSVFALQPFIMPIMGEAGMFSFSIILTIASAANIIPAFILFFILSKIKIIKDIVK